MDSIHGMPKQTARIDINFTTRNNLFIAVKTLEVGSWVTRPVRLRIELSNLSNSRAASVDPRHFFLIDKNNLALLPQDHETCRRVLLPSGSTELALDFNIDFAEVAFFGFAENDIQSASTVTWHIADRIDQLKDERRPSSDGHMPWEKEN